MSKGLFLGFFSEKRTPYAVFAIALIAHLAIFYALLYLYGPCSSFLSNDCRLNGNDTQHYVILAHNLTHGNGYSRFIDPPYEPDALRTPLLPLYLAPFAYVGGYSLVWLAILLLNIVLALAAPVVYATARFFLSHRLSILAALFMAIEPLYLYRSQIAEPDALLVLLLLSAVYFVMRSWYRGFAPDLYRAGLLLGLAILAKPSALYLAVIIFTFEAVFLVCFSKMRPSIYAKNLAIALLICAAVVFPWLARNTYVFGVAAISSIQGYNLYEYYTSDLKLSGESLPRYISEGSREPSRYLPFQSYFMQTSLARIRAQPVGYAKEQIVGTIRNLFVSDISQIIYYGHSLLLPFSYDPESKMNIHELLLAGDMPGFFKALRAQHALPKVIWMLILCIAYASAVIGWCMAWGEDRVAFLSITMFICLYGFLVISCGPFVDAKYRLPGLALIAIAALYGYRSVSRKYLLRSAGI